MAWRWDQPLEFLLRLPLHHLVALKRYWEWLDEMQADANKKAAGSGSWHWAR